MLARGQEPGRRPRISDRAAGSVLFGYLVLCILAGAILEAITDLPIGSMIIVIAVFYVLLVFLGAAIVRPIATMTMMVFKSIRRENRRDTGRGRGPARAERVQPAERGRRIMRRRRVGPPDGQTADGPTADGQAADGPPAAASPD